MDDGLGTRFWRLWGASTASNLADGVVRIGLPLVAIQFTRSPTLVAGVTVALTAPWVVCTLPAGVLADRADRRRLMTGAATLRALVLAVIGTAAMTGQLHLWSIYVAAIALGAAETVFDTTSQSIIPDLVERSQLGRANSRLYAAQVTMNEFAGAPLAGLLVGIGAAAALLAPGGLYAVAALGLLLLPGRFRPAGDSESTMLNDIGEGLRYLWHHRLLRTLGLMVAVMNFSSAASTSILVLYVVDPGPVGLGEFGYGILIATLAAGSVAGSFFTERLQRRIGRIPMLVAGVIGQAVVVGAPLVTTDASILGVAFFAGGATGMWWNVITVSMRQRIAPAHLLGRTNAGYRLLAWGTLPLGAAAGGVIGELLGIRAVFAFATVASLAVLVAFRVVTRDAIEAAEA